jgi:hypothetical protein
MLGDKRLKKVPRQRLIIDDHGSEHHAIARS